MFWIGYLCALVPMALLLVFVIRTMEKDYNRLAEDEERYFQKWLAALDTNRSEVPHD